MSTVLSVSPGSANHVQYVLAVTEPLRQWLDDDDHREFLFYEWGRTTEVGKGKHFRKTKVTVSRQQAHQALLKILHTFPSHTANAMSGAETGGAERFGWG